MLSTVCPSEGGINVVKLIPSSFDFVFFLGKWEPRLYCKKSSQEPITSKSLRSRAPSPPPREGGAGCSRGKGCAPGLGRRGVVRISNDGDDQTGAKIQTQRKSLGEILTPKKIPEQDCALFTELRGHCLRNIKTKNTGQTFLPKQIPESKISNPQNAFDRPASLEIRSTPLPRAPNIISLVIKTIFPGRLKVKVSRQGPPSTVLGDRG